MRKHNTIPTTMPSVSALATGLAISIGIGIGCSTADATPNDWLLGKVPSAPTVTTSTLDGIPTLVLSNNLVSRTFLMPQPTPVPPPTPEVPCPGKSSDHQSSMSMDEILDDILCIRELLGEFGTYCLSSSCCCANGKFWRKCILKKCVALNLV